MQGKAGIVAINTEETVSANPIRGETRDRYLNKRIKDMYEVLRDKYGYEEEYKDLSLNEMISLMLEYINLKLLNDKDGNSKVNAFDLLFESVDNKIEDAEIYNIKEDFFHKKTEGLSFETITKTNKDGNRHVYGMPLGDDFMSGNMDTSISVATDENGKKYIYTINEMPDYTEEIIIEPTDEPEMYNAKIITKALSSVNNRKNSYSNPNEIHQMTTIREGKYRMQDKYLDDYIGSLGNGISLDDESTIYHRVSTYTVDDENLGQGTITTDEVHNGEVLKNENNYTY